MKSKASVLTLSSTAQVICDLAFLNITAQKSLKQKNYIKNVFLEKFFSLFFASRLSHHNDAFLIYSAKSTKNPKMQGCGNPATLGQKNRTCHVTTPPQL
jgi:hypothetical protein